MTPKWYALSAEDAVRKLNTNAAGGLSHKTARVRYGKKRLSGERDFFYAPRKRLRAHLAPIFSDFSFWILLLTTVTLAFFPNTGLAVASLSFLLLNTALTVLLSVMSSSVTEGFSLGFSPRVKVIRDGKLLSTDYRCVVRGDIVLLSEGDVIPFDARLITAERFTVSTLVGRERTGEGRFVLTEKDASAIHSVTKALSPEEQTNMVTAGSTVRSGSARAVVVETGSYTYMGALTGGVSLMRERGRRGFGSAAARELRTLGNILLLLTVPLTVLVFFLGEPRNLAVAFLTVLSLFSAVMPGWILSVLDFIAVRSLYRGASERKVLFRTVSAAEGLASADVLMLFGRSMITDGFPHVYGICADGKMHIGKALRSDSCRAFTEKAVLLTSARRELPSEGINLFDPYDLYRREILGFAGFVGADAEMLKIRYRMLEYRAPTRAHPTEILRYTDTTAETGETLLLSSPDDLLYIRCSHILTERGKEPLTFERRSWVKNELQTYLARGCEIRSYAEKEDNGDVTFLGFFAFAEIVPRETRPAALALSEAGVRTLLFLRGEAAEDMHYALSSGLAASETEVARASEFHRSGCAIDDRFGSYSVYLGFEEEEISSLVATLETNGMKTCGVAIDREAEPLMALTSVKVACGSVDAVTRHSDSETLTEMPIDGVPHGEESTGSMKMSADVLVPRASTVGGGLSSLCEAVALSRRTALSCRVFLVYLVLAFGLRIGWTLPVLFGLGDLSPSLTLLFSTLVLDLFFGIVCAHRAGNGDTMTGVQVDFRARSTLKRGYVRLGLYGLLIGLAASILPLLPLLVEGTEITAGQITAARALALILTAVPLLYRSRRDLAGSGWDKPVSVALSAVLLILVLCGTVSSIGALFGIPTFPGILLPVSLFVPIAAFFVPIKRKNR